MACTRTHVPSHLHIHTRQETESEDAEEEAGLGEEEEEAVPTMEKEPPAAAPPGEQRIKVSMFRHTRYDTRGVDTRV